MKMDLYDFADNNNDDELPYRLKEFIKYMETMKGSSKNTTMGYSSDICLLLRFMKVKRGIAKRGTELHDIPIADIDDDFLKNITFEDMQAFLVFSSKYLSNCSSTISRKVASIRAFFKYLTNKVKVCPVNNSVDLDKPKIGKRKPKYLNLNEANKLLDCVSSRNETRDKLIITLFLNCGMRLAELCSINVSDIKKDTIRIIGKGNKERTIYLNETCIDAIEAYMKARNELCEKKAITTDALIISERGNRIGRRTVQGIVERQLDNAGLGGKGYSTHKLRHSAATLLYKYGKVDVLVLKEILGHEEVSTTQIYTHTDNDMIRDAVKVNPLNNKSKVI